MENLPVVLWMVIIQPLLVEIIRMTEAVSTFRITRHYADEVEARSRCCGKVFYGYLSIPSGFEAR